MKMSISYTPRLIIPCTWCRCSENGFLKITALEQVMYKILNFTSKYKRVILWRLKL